MLDLAADVSNCRNVLRFSGPACFEDVGWTGPAGSCLEYERLGMCFDGQASENATLDGAEFHCCVCGRGQGLREGCSVQSYDELVLAAHVEVLAGSFGRYVDFFSVEDHGFDPAYFRHTVSTLVAYVAAFANNFLRLLRRLLLLGLCGRVCDAVLPALLPFHVSQRQVLSNIPLFMGDYDIDEIVDWARRSCRRAFPMDQFIERLDFKVHDMFTISVLASAFLLNRYFASATSLKRDVFVAGEWQGVRDRWSVVRYLLEDLGCTSSECTAVEIGVFAGETSTHLLDNLPLLRLHGVDPYVVSEEFPEAGDQLFDLAITLYQAHGSRAWLHRKVSSEVVGDIGSVDFVFVDGSHNYEAVKADLLTWAPLTRRLAGHDLNLGNGAVARAVYEWSNGRTVWVMPAGVWYVDV